MILAFAHALLLAVFGPLLAASLKYNGTIPEGWWGVFLVVACLYLVVRIPCDLWAFRQNVQEYRWDIIANPYVEDDHLFVRFGV